MSFLFRVQTVYHNILSSYTALSWILYACVWENLFCLSHWLGGFLSYQFISTHHKLPSLKLHRNVAYLTFAIIILVDALKSLVIMFLVLRIGDVILNSPLIDLSLALLFPLKLFITFNFFFFIYIVWPPLIVGCISHRDIDELILILL